MSVEVLYFADLREITQKRHEKIRLTEFSISELAEILFQKYSGLKKHLWSAEKNGFKPSISVVINDQKLSENNILTHKLEKGDKIAFLLPISGG
ncbi:MAG: MoaD/ThiS family protein [Promethearchaeia archaeon]